jgi:hypothetical protein
VLTSVPVGSLCPREEDRDYCGINKIKKKIKIKIYIYIYIYIYILSPCWLQGHNASDPHLPALPHSRLVHASFNKKAAMMSDCHLGAMFCHSTYHSMISLSLGGYLITVRHLCCLILLATYLVPKGRSRSRSRSREFS